MDSAATVAIVGRPNVGKSTLFNRLIGKKHAITSDIAGTTRDRIAQKFSCGNYDILLVDTGGLEYGKKENIEADIQSQAKLAIEEADLILLIVDGSQELTVDDFTAADILRKSNKEIVFIANKCDNPDLTDNIFNIYELGFDEPIKISAIHKTGIDDLKYQIAKRLEKLKFPKRKAIKTPTDEINICILGQPNAGKSSLLNALTNSQKAIVSDIPGTTRDAVDTHLVYNEQKFNLVDTAGLRRSGKRGYGIEKFSALRCINSIEKSDIAILLIDGIKGITNQDCHIAQLVLEAEKGLILAINKIDLFDNEEEDHEKGRLYHKLQRKFIFVPWAPMVFVSAKNKRNTYKLLDLASEIMIERKKRISTAEINSFFQKITYKHMPASTKIQKPKFFYCSQVDINPPRFVLFFRNPKNLHFSYPRYLENELRKEYGFNGTPVHLKFKNKVEEKDSETKS